MRHCVSSGGPAAVQGYLTTSSRLLRLNAAGFHTIEFSLRLAQIETPQKDGKGGASEI